MTISIGGTTGVTFPDASVQATAATGFGFKNRIINGAMVIDQRNAGASVTPSAATAVYTVDRWIAYQSQASKFSVQQNAGSVTPPAGFTNYLGVTSLSSYSVGSTEEYEVQHRIEAFNCSDLNWGTASAASVTLSFWVRSSLTGTFSGAVSNSAANRCYVFSYTISSANTWEQKTITIAGDQSGTWLNSTNGIGLRINFSIGAGATNLGTAGSWGSTFYVGATGTTSVVGTSGATFYITGVQLEKGSTATAFDVRDYGRELIMCQRYYQYVNTSSPALGAGYYGSMTSGQQVYSIMYFPVAFRSAATVTASTFNSNVAISSVSSISVFSTTAFVSYGSAPSTSSNAYVFFNYTASAEL